MEITGFAAAIVQIFSGFATTVIIIGSYTSTYISDQKLKPAFGWFVMVMGVYILTRGILFSGL